MGGVLQRNRFWWYRSMYDDYLLREIRLTLGIGAFIWLPMYWWGIHLNREFDILSTRKNYLEEFGPQRNRLTHSLLFEEFEVSLEKWQDLEDEYKEKGDAMLDEE